MKLTTREQRILGGEEGEARQFAMSILTKMGEACDAECFTAVQSAHVVGSSYQITQEAGIDLYQRLVDQGAKVSVPTTADPGAIDFARWKEHRVDERWADRQVVVRDLLNRLGVIPLWTCIPYYLINVPLYGQDIAWSESSAVVFVNSVIGARTNRMSAYIDLCAAMVGMVPRFGLHVPAQRAGDFLIELDEDVSRRFEDVHFPILGFRVGQIAGDRIPVISGIRNASFEQLKSLGAAMAAAGSVAMYHIVGLTPEAPTVEAAFGGRKPSERIPIGAKELRETLHTMRTCEGGAIDAVGIGCPNATVKELGDYAALLDGKRVHPNVQLWVCTNDIVEELGRRMGYVTTIEKAGGRMITGTCLNNCPLNAWKFENLVTNSGKYAYYNPTNLGTKCYYTSTRSCIEAAVRGAVDGEEPI